MEIADTAVLMDRLDCWERSTEFDRTCRNPVDAGQQMALRDAHALLSDMSRRIHHLEFEEESRLCAQRRDGSAADALGRMRAFVMSWRGRLLEERIDRLQGERFGQLLTLNTVVAYLDQVRDDG